MNDELNFTDYSKTLEINAGDRLLLEAESDVSEGLNGKFEIDVKTGLGSETLCDKPGFEQKTASDRVTLDPTSGHNLTMVVRTQSTFDDRSDVIAKIQLAGGRTVAKVTSIEVVEDSPKPRDVDFDTLESCVKPLMPTLEEIMENNPDVFDPDYETEIGTTLAKINDHYGENSPVDRVAEAVIERADRRVDYIYDISYEDETPLLCVNARYYFHGELVNQSNTTQTYPTDGDRVYHTDSGQELYEFIEANAFSDPEVTLTDEFESMVSVDE